MSDLLMSISAGTAAGILIVVLVGIKPGASELIEHGCGQYDSQTGQFIWNDEKEQ